MQISLVVGLLVVLALISSVVAVVCVKLRARRRAKWEAVKREGEAAERAEKKRQEDAKRDAWLAQYSDGTLIQGQPWERLKQHAMKDGFEVSYWFVSSLCGIKNCLECARRGRSGSSPPVGTVPESTGRHGKAEVPS